MTRGEFLREVKRRRWAIKQTGSGHYRVTHPSGVWRMCSYSPRSGHTFSNFLKAMERAAQQAESDV